MRILIVFVLIMNFQFIYPVSKLEFVANPNISGQNDYGSILIIRLDSGNHIMTILGSYYSFMISGKVYNNKYQIEVDTNLIDIWDLRFVKVYIDLDVGITKKNSIALELRDTSENNALGLVYISQGTNISSYLSQTEVDTLQGIKDKVDSVWAEEGFTVGSGDTLGITTSTQGGVEKSDAYIISFDQPDPYESGYTLAELDYEYIYQNSATDYLEKILDTDRNNELVGFRYYSELNGEEYTIFIKANN